MQNDQTNSNNGSKYKTQAGDTLSSIAAKSGMSLQALVEANKDISNPDLLYPGKTINIPSASASGGGTIVTTGQDATQTVVYDANHNNQNGGSTMGEPSKSPEDTTSQALSASKPKTSFLSKFKFF
jgi:LysM repeat protein